MKIKYSPVHTNKDTIIEAIGENTLRIDGQDYEFDPESVTWPDISEQTEGVILEAHRELVPESGREVLGALEELEYVIDVPEHMELFVVVLRFYSGSCSGWDTGDYHATDW